MPWRWPARRTLVLIAAVCVVGFVAFGALTLAAGAELAPNGILAFEFAFKPAHANAILETWGQTGRGAARRSLLLDVGFIVLGYAPLLASLCLLLTRRTTRRRQEW